MIAADPSFIQAMDLVRSAVVNRAASRAYMAQGHEKVGQTLARLADGRAEQAMTMTVEGWAPLAANSE